MEVAGYLLIQQLGDSWSDISHTASSMKIGDLEAKITERANRSKGLNRNKGDSERNVKQLQSQMKEMREELKAVKEEANNLQQNQQQKGSGKGKKGGGKGANRDKPSAPAGAKPVAGRDGRTYAHVQCHECNKHGHFKDQCPLGGGGTGGGGSGDSKKKGKKGGKGTVKQNQHQMRSASASEAEKASATGDSPGIAQLPRKVTQSLMKQMGVLSDALGAYSDDSDDEKASQ